MPNTTVARETLLARRPGEEPFEIIIEIGTPYRYGSDPEEWACPVSLKGLYVRNPDMHGGSALQALCLATTLAFRLLTYFVEDGGTLHEADGGEFALEATFGRGLPPTQPL